MANKAYVLELMDGSVVVKTDSWDQVQKIPRKNVKGFKTINEAEAFVRAGAFGEAVQNASGRPTVTVSDISSGIVNKGAESAASAGDLHTRADAIIYVDGSFPSQNRGDFSRAGYGTIIFQKDRNPVIESALIEDASVEELSEFEKGVSKGAFYLSRHDFSTEESVGKEAISERLEYIETKLGSSDDPDRRGIVATGWATAGEFVGAARALKYARENGCHDVILGFDAMEIMHAGNKVIKKYDGNPDSTVFSLEAESESNSSNFFREEVLRCLKNGLKIRFNKISSHGLVKNGETMLGSVDGVFNDACDILAKCELVDMPVGSAENPNIKMAVGSADDLKVINELNISRDRESRRELRKVEKRVIDEAIKSCGQTVDAFLSK